MTFPTKCDLGSAPREIVALIQRLVPQLIAGDHPALIALQEQFRHAEVKQIEMTGHGFYADFSIPLEAPLARPADFTGGNAEIVLQGVADKAGCVLFVREGRLAFLEGYTFGDEGWPLDACVLEVKNIEPIDPDRIA